MSQYRFHVFNDHQTVDDDGRELPDLDAARVIAVEGARGIMAEELKRKGCIDLAHWIEIEDEDGDITVVTFGDAVTVKSTGP